LSVEGYRKKLQWFTLRYYIRVSIKGLIKTKGVHSGSCPVIEIQVALHSYFYYKLCSLYGSHSAQSKLFERRFTTTIRHMNLARMPCAFVEVCNIVG